MDVFALAMGYASSSAEGAAGCDLLTDDGPIPDEIDDAVRTAIVDIADRMECLDMRAVIILEFWAMMAGALPFGWDISSCGHQAWGPGMSGTKSRELEYGLGEIVAREAWAAEYTARPRLER